MAEHIHNPHSATGMGGVHHQQQSPPQPPYPWNNGLSGDVSTRNNLFDKFSLSLSLSLYPYLSRIIALSLYDVDAVRVYVYVDFLTRDVSRSISFARYRLFYF